MAHISTPQSAPLALADVKAGDELPSINFPLSLYRLVMWAGANRDFNSIHHNTEYARATGAPDLYANTMFLMGTWERLVRDWMGPQGQIVAIRKFSMKRFNLVGRTITTSGRVVSVADDGLVSIEVWTADPEGVTVGPGIMEVRLEGPRG